MCGIALNIRYTLGCAWLFRCFQSFFDIVPFSLILTPLQRLSSNSKKARTLLPLSEGSQKHAGPIARHISSISEDAHTLVKTSALLHYGRLDTCRRSFENRVIAHTTSFPLAQTSTTQPTTCPPCSGFLLPRVAHIERPASLVLRWEQQQPGHHRPFPP